MTALRRALLVGWLRPLRKRMMLHTVFPDQYPYDPNLLPIDFPCTNFVIHKNLVFLTASGRRTCRIALKYFGPTLSRSHLWMITYQALILGVCEDAEPLILGVFEVPPEIWDDPYRTFLIGADLVIDVMIQSVKARSTKFVLIAKYVEHPVWDGAQHYGVQTVTLMNASDWRGGRQGESRTKALRVPIRRHVSGSSNTLSSALSVRVLQIWFLVTLSSGQAGWGALSRII
ncbi:hypothetical protein B0H13DRAFT_1887563 [Mycena leptocephala]|nr:hypothetical protein B0H13DRAFT_1887563 [Mycena leptocephala]